MKILINTPQLTPQGGVANHYLGLRPYWNENVKYNVIGKRNGHVGSGKYWLAYDILKFILKIIILRPDIIILNPSLALGSLKRDCLFLKIATFFGIKASMFFHGFNKSNIPRINTTLLAQDLNKCACVFVLAHEFSEIIKSWGVTVPIHLTTTKVDDRLIKDFDINTRTGDITNILFLSRITKAKGIFITLDTFKILSDKHDKLLLNVVGNGADLENAKQYCQNNNIKNVIFHGKLTGKQLIDAYTDADLYIFTSYYEGMPTSVLEAMAFGLPVITRPVGGLVDFFENGKMGESINSLDPSDFANAAEKYISDKKLTQDVSCFNHKYAKSHFMASSVTRNIEETLRMYV